MWFIYYVLLGTLFMLIMDLLHIFLESSQEPFNNYERIIVIISWPIPLLIFIYNFIKSFLR